MEYLVYGFLVIAVVGSIYSIRKWFKSGKGSPSMRPREATD